MNPSRRILFIAGCWYPDDENPIHGIFIRRHAEAAALENEIVVLHVALRSDAPTVPEFKWSRHGRLRELHVKAQGLVTSRGGALQSQRAYFKATRLGLKELAGTIGSFDFLHYQVIPSAAVVLALRLSLPGLPYGISEHWSGYMPESGVHLGWTRRLYTSWLCRHAAFISTVSRYHAGAMQASGFKGRYLVIPNVVDTRLFKPRQQRSPGPFRLILVASLRPEKQVPAIIRSVCRCIRDGLDLELNIVGDGLLREAAEAAVSPRNLIGKTIIFHGQQDEAGVAERLRDADALVLFSSFENSPCVLAEAMACGLPVIAPRIGGIPEHIAPERGILVPPGDPDAFAAAMKSLAQRGRIWDSHAIRAYAEETFSQEIIARLFDDVYEGVARAQRDVECR